jgi:hypothetical protein
VPPDTLENETRFWRNLAVTKPTTTTRIGLLILGLFVFGFMVAIIRIFSRAGILWWTVLSVAMLLVWGPIFAAIVWATKRSLKDIENAHRDFAGRHKPGRWNNE